MARTRMQGGPTGDCPPRTLPHRESTGAFRLRRPCLRRRAAVVPRIGRFSGVDQVTAGRRGIWPARGPTPGLITVTDWCYINR